MPSYNGLLMKSKQARMTFSVEQDGLKVFTYDNNQVRKANYAAEIKEDKVNK
jgi:hypothetical protein